MDVLTDLQQRLQSRTVDTARTAQAAAIAALDHLVATAPAEGKLVGVTLAMQLELLERLVGEPAGAVDRQYRFVGHLLELHREFAQRVLEVMEGADVGRSMTGDDPSLARVVPLPIHLSRTAP